MAISIRFSKKTPASADTIILLVFKSKTLSVTAESITPEQKKFITSALAKNPTFTAACGQTLTLTLAGSATAARYVMLGLGEASAFSALKAEEAGGKLYAALKGGSAKSLAIVLDKSLSQKTINTATLAAHLACGFNLRSYTFDHYKSKKNKNPEAVKPPSSLDLVLSDQTAAQKIYGSLEAQIKGVFSARDLVNEPPNILYPESYAKRIAAELKPLGVQVDIFDEKRLEKLGMGGILGVGQGSDKPPRVVIMRWNGGTKKTKSAPIALVGKGMTFDSGGISIKPAAGMDEMKMDMGGSAAVVGTLKALALRKAKVNVVGIVGLAENMPSGTAYRPADILTMYSGKTVEVLNTDAEGRLVLGDCLSYVQEIYKPQIIIDLATLTGAIMVALGHEYCGTFVNNNDLWAKLEKSSQNTDEKLWRMPLDEAWRKDIEANFADIQNIGKSTGRAGACTAAAFLEHFIENNTPWAHLDIAGTAWRNADKPTVPKFGSGFGVRLLCDLIAQNYED
jgi:leucyl aminopeptidase